MPTSPLPVLMFLVGCGMLTMILLRRSQRYFGRRVRRSKTEGPIATQPRPDGPWSGAHRDAAALIERQKVEFYDLTRDAAGQLDSKMIVLQELIAQSQRQVERMETLLAELNAQAS